MTQPPPTNDHPSFDTPYQRGSDYPRHYRDHRFCVGSGPRTHHRELRAIEGLLAAGSQREGLWLDMPSGAGRLSPHLPGPATLVDRDRSMLAAAGAGSPRVQARARELPFADDHFVGALCMRLLHHIPRSAERVAILTELRRVTDGPILLSFFHSLCLQHLRRVVTRALRLKPRSGRCAVRVAQIRRDLEAAGLRAVADAPLLPWISEQWLIRAERL